MQTQVKDLDKIFNAFIRDQNITEINSCLNNRKQNGIYFTSSSSIIDYIFECIPNDMTIFEKKFLEPSCGEGAFILKLILKVYEINQNELLISDFIEKKVFFNDTSDIMVEKTKHNIKKLFKELFGVEYSGKFNDFCSDFTLVQTKQFTLFDEQSTSPIFDLYGTMDYIIGNPPYITLYGRRDKKTSEEQRIYFLSNYNQFPSHVKNGKINFVMLFIEHGLRFLNNKGVLSYVIDLSFFETAYMHCRKYIAQNFTIKNLIYNINDFDSVASGQIILTLENKTPITEHLVKIINEENKEISFIPQLLWNNPEDEFKFRLSTNLDAETILNKIYKKNDPTLFSLYPRKNLRTCTMLLNMESQFTGELSTVENIKVYPYYRGSRGVRYKYSKPNYEKYFYYNKKLQDQINDKLKDELEELGIKNKKRIGLGEIEVYDNPKVYIRQSAKELIATFDPKPSAANNSLYVFSLRDNSENSIFFLKYLCGILNSTIYTYFAQQRRIVRYNKGKQPQIKISDLYQIMIPVDKNLQREIVNIVDQIYEKPEKTSSLSSQIDALLYSYYDLSIKEVQQINSAFESLI